MSLSRVVKKPGNIVFNEVVQIKDKPLIKADLVKLSDASDFEISSQVLRDTQIEAERLIHDAQKQIDLMRLQFDEECKELYSRVKDEGYEKGYQEGLLSYKTDALSKLENLNHKLIELEAEREKEVFRQIDDLQNKIYSIGLDVANKILRHKIEMDDSILKNLIIDEIDSREGQNVTLVELSRKAESLILEIENELELKGITLRLVNEDKDHVVIESEMSEYDLSISTQIKNIKRLFNTL